MADQLNAAQLQEMMKAQVSAMFQLELEKRGGAFDLSRKLVIDQQKAKFKNPADKRAIAFLLDVQYDLTDFHDGFKKLLDAEGNLKDVATNAALVEDFLKSVPVYGNKVFRKITREVESYNIANNSRYGWASEKFYRQEDTFVNNQGLDAAPVRWYEQDDISKEDKVKKLHRAECQAALNLKQKKQFSKFEPTQRGGKRSRWGPASETVTSASASSAPVANATSGPAFAPAQLYHPPAGAGPMCFNCHKFGHIRSRCPLIIKKEN